MRYSHHTHAPNAPLPTWQAQVMYTTSKHHSRMPGRERSSPAEMSVPVVGSRRGEPMRSRYRERKTEGTSESAYTQNASVVGRSAARLKSRRRRRESAHETSSPRRRFLIVSAFCCADHGQT